MVAAAGSLAGLLIATPAGARPLPPSASPREASVSGEAGAGPTGRTIRLHGAGDRAASTIRPARRVLVDTLPKATGHERAYASKLRSAAVPGSAGPAPRAPQAPLVAPTPAFATIDSANPAVEAVSTSGAASTVVEPPDPFVAAGPDHVVQATNAGIRITNRTGGAPKAYSLQDFFGISAVGGGYQAEAFDPRVIFDSLHGRWLATESSFDCYPDPGHATVGTGYIDIAISDTADPNLGWSVLSLPYSDTVADYPGLGTSTDKIVVSANVFPLVPDGGAPLGCDVSDPFIGTELDVVGWAQMLGTGSVDIAYLTSYIAPADFPNEYFAWRPALQAPATSSTVFGVGIHSAVNGDVAWFRITGLPSATTTLTRGDVGAGAIAPFEADVPAPAQPGEPATIESAVDGRPTDALWQANRLVFVSTIGCDPAGGVAEDRDCVRVSELAAPPTSPPTVTQDLLIAEEGRDLFMGGVGLSGSSDLHVIWTGSSAAPGDYASTFAAYQLRGAGANTLTGRQKITAGIATYPSTRWGDYVGVAQDPQVADAVWQGDEVATAAGWATEVSQLRTSAGSTYTPIAPSRIVDSRIGTGLAGVFAANTPRTFAVAGAGSVPAAAIAVTGNVTLVGQTAAGFLAVTPTATATPASSTINVPRGDIRANNFTLPLGPGGSLAAVFKAVAGSSTHVVVDITGYFTAAAGGATYQPLASPVRVLDSRQGGTGLGGAFSARVGRALQVAGVGGIPAAATAVSANLTVVNQTAAGYLAVTPAVPAGLPASSTLNFPRGDIRANGLTAALGPGGSLAITYVAVAGARADVVLDVTGYYLADGSGLRFHALAPGRLLDSRATVLTGLSGPFSANVARTLPTAGHWGVPTTARAITANLTVVGQTAAGFVAATPLATNSPATSTLNVPLGDIRANGITVPLGGGSEGLVYKAVSGRTAHLVLDVTGYFE
jgi:hypothetical protein